MDPSAESVCALTLIVFLHPFLRSFARSRRFVDLSPYLELAVEAQSGNPIPRRILLSPSSGFALTSRVCAIDESGTCLPCGRPPEYQALGESCTVD